MRSRIQRREPNLMQLHMHSTKRSRIPKNGQPALENEWIKQINRFDVLHDARDAIVNDVCSAATLIALKNERKENGEWANRWETKIKTSKIRCAEIENNQFSETMSTMSRNALDTERTEAN